jgi:hypothetical protein
VPGKADGEYQHRNQIILFIERLAKVYAERNQGHNHQYWVSQHLDERLDGQFFTVD